MGFPTKNDHFGVFWGYHHLRKHPHQQKPLSHRGKHFSQKVPEASPETQKAMMALMMKTSLSFHLFERGRFGVSKNHGIPKSSIKQIGFSIIFTIHFGVSLIFGNTRLLLGLVDLGPEFR